MSEEQPQSLHTQQSQRTQQTEAATERFFEVDAVKGFGILVVVLIHSLRSPWTHGGISGAEEWLGHVTRFAVPGFFAASGYLYATRRAISRKVTSRRLVRLLVPYVLASVCAQVYVIATSQTPENGPIWRDFLLASSFGPYYFVLILAIFIAVSPLFVRLGTRSFGLLLIPLLLAQLLLETGVIPQMDLFWYLRNPFLWAGYFAVGWWLRLQRESIVAAVAAHRARWLAVSVGLWIPAAAVLTVSLPRFAIASTAWFAMFASLAIVFSASAGRRQPGPWLASLRWLSDASYPVYLYHLFFVKVAARWIEIERRVFEPEKLFAIWACGVLGSLALVWLGRKLLGSRSRTWIGA